MKLKTILTAGLLAFSAAGLAQNDRTTKFEMEKLELTQEWDKVFPQSDKVDHSKITFHNRMASRSPPTCTNPRTRQASSRP